MSKKLYVIPVVVALLALMAVPATASEASTTVELTIDPYCNVTISGPISVTVSGGSGAIPLTEADVTVECNRSDHVISGTRGTCLLG